MSQERKSKRQGRRAKIVQQEKRNRLIMIGLVTLGAILVVAAVVYPQLKPIAEVVSVEPRTYPTPKDNSMGDPNAPIKLEEFADFQCPQCAAEHPTMNEIKAMYGSRIKFIFREFPLDIKAHDKSYDAAVAAEAAGLQGKFWEMQNLLFTNQKSWTEDPNFKQTWKGYAQKIGLDIAKWETDIAGMAARSRVDEDKKRGKAIGLQGTPSLFINGSPVQLSDMNVSTLKTMIDAELAKGAAPQQQGGPQPTSRVVPGSDAAAD